MLDSTSSKPSIPHARLCVSDEFLDSNAPHQQPPSRKNAGTGHRPSAPWTLGFHTRRAAQLLAGLGCLEGAAGSSLPVGLLFCLSDTMPCMAKPNKLRHLGALGLSTNS